MNRTEQYQQLEKLRYTVNQFNKYYLNTLKIIESEDFEIYPPIRMIHDILIREKPIISNYIFECTELVRLAEISFKKSKPTKFTPEQIKEIRYALELGVTMNKIMQKYHTRKSTVLKYLQQSNLDEVGQ